VDGAAWPPFASPSFPPAPAASAEDVAALNRALKRAMYAPIFSVPNPERQNTPILASGSPNVMIGVEVNEQLHRLDLRDVVPGASGFAAENRVGEPVASVHIRWMVAPDDFAAAPARVPPPTPLNPTRSQRFVMLDGHLAFQDRTGSGVRAFGAGRTFPSMTPAGPQLQIGAVIDVLEGLGRLRGLAGTIVVNGHIRPPNELALNLMARFMDPSGRLSTSEPIAPVRSTRSVDPGTLFVAFLGEDDPDRGTQPIFQQGQMLGARVFERLRLVRLEFECSGRRFSGRVREGDLVGRLSAQLHFNAMDPRPVFPIQTTEGEFTFHDVGGQEVGTIRANMVEGRAFRSILPGAPMPVFRFGGFGPILGGTGAFGGTTGMMSMNSVISVFPRTLSNLYVLRLVDRPGQSAAPAFAV
jgi:hypothetical protein